VTTIRGTVDKHSRHSGASSPRIASPDTRDNPSPRNTHSHRNTQRHLRVTDANFSHTLLSPAHLIDHSTSDAQPAAHFRPHSAQLAQR
jgi:hypothetical protein